MKIFSISDLHLSFGVPNKSMDLFGDQWKSHFKKIEKSWKESVGGDDLVCIAGDISWAMHLKEVQKDLEWIDELPGTKCIIKGNHDYWFTSKKKMEAILPPTIRIIHNDAFHFRDIAIAGSRLWDSPYYNFDMLFPKKSPLEKPEKEGIYERELQRLELSLSRMNPNAKIKIAMTHYPPVSLDGRENPVSRLLEKHQVSFCLFGHLHGLNPSEHLFGIFRGVDYRLTACDYLNFKLLEVISF